MDLVLISLHNSTKTNILDKKRAKKTSRVEMCQENFYDVVQLLIDRKMEKQRKM